MLFTEDVEIIQNRCISADNESSIFAFRSLSFTRTIFNRCANVAVEACIDTSYNIVKIGKSPPFTQIAK